MKGKKITLLLLVGTNLVLLFTILILNRYNEQLYDCIMDYNKEKKFKYRKYINEANYIPPHKREYLIKYLEANNKLDSLYQLPTFFDSIKANLYKYESKDFYNKQYYFDEELYEKLAKGDLKFCKHCKQLFYKEHQYNGTVAYLLKYTNDDDFIKNVYFFREIKENNCDKVKLGTYYSGLKYIYANNRTKPIVTAENYFMITDSLIKDSLKIFYPINNGTMLVKSDNRWY